MGPLDVVAWDEKRGRLFLVIPTGTAKNHPWVLVGYDLRTNQIVRYGEHVSGGVSSAAPSPSGRYLALVDYAVCGVCCTSSNIAVADLQDRRMGLRPRERTDTALDAFLIDDFRWTSESELEYQGEAHSQDACHQNPESYTKQKRTGRLKVSDFLFK
jgi:hypothetical protein